MLVTLLTLKSAGFARLICVCKKSPASAKQNRIVADEFIVFGDDRCKVGHRLAPNLTKNLFFFRLQASLDPLPRLGAQGLRWQTVLMLRMLMGSRAEKPDLLSVAAAPLAENQMYPQSDALTQSERMVEYLGLQTRRIATTRRKLTYLSEESFQHFRQRIHYNTDSPSCL